MGSRYLIVFHGLTLGVVVHQKLARAAALSHSHVRPDRREQGNLELGREILQGLHHHGSMLESPVMVDRRFQHTAGSRGILNLAERSSRDFIITAVCWNRRSTMTGNRATGCTLTRKSSFIIRAVSRQAPAPCRLRVSILTGINTRCA